MISSAGVQGRVVFAQRLGMKQQDGYGRWSAMLGLVSIDRRLNLPQWQNENPATRAGLSACSHRASHSLENGASPKTGSRLAEVGDLSRGVAATLDHSPHPSYNGPCCEVVARSSLTGRSRLVSGLVNWAGNLNLVQNCKLANRHEH